MEQAIPTAGEAEARERATAHGWTDTSKLDYGALTESAPVWASDAVVYEWDGEEGEVGPPNPALEERLFKSENQQRAGAALKALDMNVTQEGPVQISPILKVFQCILQPYPTSY